MFWNMAIFGMGTSLLPRAQSHARICAAVLYGDAPQSPRVWAHHSPSPKRNLRKGWFFELCFFFWPTQFYSILLDSTASTQFYSISTQFYSILLDSTQFYSILLKFMQNQYKSQITTTQASASPGDSSIGTTGPDYMGIGMGPRARPGVVRKLYKKTCNLDTPPRALRGTAFTRLDSILLLRLNSTRFRLNSTRF